MTIAAPIASQALDSTSQSTNQSSEDLAAPVAEDQQVEDWEKSQSLWPTTGRNIVAADGMASLDALALTLGILVVVAGIWALTVDWIDLSFVGMPGRARARRLLYEEISR